jgi:hypothetical protein
MLVGATGIVCGWSRSIWKLCTRCTLWGTCCCRDCSLWTKRLMLRIYS